MCGGWGNQGLREMGDEHQHMTITQSSDFDLFFEPLGLYLLV